MKRDRVLTAVAAMAVAAFLVGSPGAIGDHTPADKIVAAGSKVVQVGPAQSVEILSARLRTASPTDLMLQVNLECSILTQLITGGENAESSMARGDIRAWVELDGRIVPINSDGGGAPGDESDKVTFCNRTYSRSVSDTENDDDGTDTIDDYIDTKTSNSFTWVLLNAGNGVHEIVVKADLTFETAGDAMSSGYIGNRTLVVEPGKLANDAHV